MADQASTTTTLENLNERARSILRDVVESYLTTGEPVGSRTLARLSPLALSPATIRNVLSDLEMLGLLYAPHTSAGRLPTDAGLRLFVDGLLEIGDLTEDERKAIEARVAGTDRDLEGVLTEASSLLSGLSHCAGLVVTPKHEGRIKHLEFVALDARSALVVIVSEDGIVENRVIETPAGTTPASLAEATNYLNARLRGRTFEEARQLIVKEIESHKAELDALTAEVVGAGLATWSGRGESGDTLSKSLIVRGQSRLLEDVTAIEDLERVRRLFDDLEGKKELIHLLGLAEDAQGVSIFIGSETKLFSLSGSSLIVSPYKNTEQQVVGVLGVIGPTRLNYARVIPMVDYTAKVVGQLLS